jgi:hypothetical protein
MRGAWLGHPTTVGALPAGACFAFDWHGQAFIGLKVIDDFATHAIASCAALWPGHPELGDGPAFLDGSFGPATGVHELDHMVIVPSTSLAAWRIGADLAAVPGIIVHAREKLLMGVARRNGKVVFVDLAAGKTTLLPENTPLLHIGGWRLMQKLLDSYETIGSYEVPLDEEMTSFEECALSRSG